MNATRMCQQNAALVVQRHPTIIKSLTIHNMRYTFLLQNVFSCSSQTTKINNQTMFSPMHVSSFFFFSAFKGNKSPKRRGKKVSKGIPQNTTTDGFIII